MRVKLYCQQCNHAEATTMTHETLEEYLAKIKTYKPTPKQLREDTKQAFNKDNPMPFAVENALDCYENLWNEHEEE